MPFDDIHRKSITDALGRAAHVLGFKENSTLEDSRRNVRISREDEIVWKAAYGDYDAEGTSMVEDIEDDAAFARAQLGLDLMKGALLIEAEQIPLAIGHLEETFDALSNNWHESFVLREPIDLLKGALSEMWKHGIKVDVTSLFFFTEEEVTEITITSIQNA